MRKLFAVLAAAGSFACGDTSAPSINPVDYLLAEIDGSWSASAASFMALSNTPASLVRVDASTCPYDPATKFFVCPARFDRGLTYNLSFQLLNGGGNPLAAYDAAATAGVKTVTDVEGTRAFPGTTFTSALKSHGERTLTGILANTPTVNGTESATFINTSSSFIDTTYNTVTITDFKVQPRNSPTFPSGVITHGYYSEAPAPGASAIAIMTLTFDNSQFMKMVYWTAAFTETCTFDLKGIAAPVCS